MKRKKVTVIGPINADIMVVGGSPELLSGLDWESPADISLCVAGSAGYTLQDFQALGCQTKIFSSIGGDGIGAGLLDEMNRSGIDSSLLHIHREERTAIGVYWLMYGNKKRPLAYHMSSFPPGPKPGTAASSMSF